MSKQPTPKQRRSQRGSVEDRWRKRIKDSDGNSVEVPSAVAGEVTRWRARYVDNAGSEHTRHFDRKVEAQRWLDKQLAALLRGDHVAPRDAKMTVGEWCDKWLAGYGTRRASTVRQAEVHVKIIKAHFGSVPMSAVKPSDVRAWTVVLKKEGRANSYIYAIYCVSPRSSPTPSTTGSSRATRARGAPRRAWASNGPTSPPLARCGRSTTRCRPACGPRSCSAPTPGCALLKRRRCGSQTSTSPLGSSRRRCSGKTSR